MQGLRTRLGALDPRTVDLLVGGTLALWTLGVAMGSPQERAPHTVVTAIVAFVVGGSLYWWRTQPLLAAVVLTAAIGVDGAVGGRLVDNTSTLVPLVFLAYSLGRHATGRARVAGLLLVALGSPIGAIATGLTQDGVLNIVAFDVLVAAALPAAAGVVVRRRAALIAELSTQRVELERRRDARVRTAAAGERVRIATELHDIVVHDVSAMVVQASAAHEIVRTEPLAAAEAIARVEGAGRLALDELRRALGVLRSTDGALALQPQPTLVRLPHLIEALRREGAAVDLDVDPAATGLPAGVQLAVYRIVQELLGGRFAHASVSVRGDEDGVVVVEVRSDGTEPAADALTAVRARAGLYDGLLEATTEPGGRSRVCARLTLPT